MNYPESGEADPIPGTDPVETTIAYLIDANPGNASYPITVDFYRAGSYGSRQGSAFITSDTYTAPGAIETVILVLPAGIGSSATSPRWPPTPTATPASSRPRDR
ncbi:MAG TPA: hypothetical protein VKO85_12460 [Wenzhouxiangellaceae bacterium]|nr:hypothetical protein [Wenzhouxiangellaceae bacterium]